MDGNSIILLAGIVIIFVVCMAIFVSQLVKIIKHRKDDTVTKRKVSKKTNNLMWIYNLYKNTPFLKRYFVKVRSKVSLLYPADGYSINLMTSRILAKGTFGGLIAVALTLILSQGSVFYLCAGLLISYVVITEIVTNSVNNLEFTIMEQLQDAIQKVRHHYHECKNVDLAILLCIDEVPYEIGLHLQNIYDIITSPNMKYETDKYIDTCPDKMMLTFLAICSSVKEAGDGLVDGKSKFLTGLEQLHADVADDILMRKKSKYAFMGLSWISLFPVIAVKPAEAWVVTNMEEVKSFYSGIYGIVSMIAIFVLSFIAHALIVSLRDKEREIEKDNDLFAKIADVPVISDFLSKVIRKNFSRYNYYNNEMKGMGDHTGPKAFLLKRVTFAVVTFVATILILFFSGISQKINDLNDFSEAFATSTVPNDEYRENMRSIAKEYTAMSKKDDIKPEDLILKIMKETGLKQTYAEQVAEFVDSRLSDYYNTYFKWFYILIALALAAVGYMVPVWMLKFKHPVINMRKQEEVLQFQSLILILMYMDGIDLEEILEWLERFSYCFKEEIATCRMNLNSGQERALSDMQALVQYQPFSNFVDNLKAIDKVGVIDAFDEVKQEREYSRKQKEIEMTESLKEKASKARIASYVPVFATLILYMLVPMSLYAVQMYAEFQSIT